MKTKLFSAFILVSAMICGIAFNCVSTCQDDVSFSIPVAYESDVELEFELETEGKSETKDKKFFQFYFSLSILGQASCSKDNEVNKSALFKELHSPPPDYA